MKLGRDTRVLITGASRGIGRATAEQFAARGCVLGLVARSTEDLEQLAGKLRPRATAVSALKADVADADQISKAISSFVEQSGGLEVLVANAGIGFYGPFRDSPLDEAERMTRVNWLGTIYTVAAALPHLIDRAHGRMVIVSSRLLGILHGISPRLADLFLRRAVGRSAAPAR